MKIAVIGGAGVVGSRLVTLLRARGHHAIAASPGTGVNTLTGGGLDAALTGASTVVDVSSSPSLQDAAVLEFLRKPTRNLLRAEAEAGVHHHVVLSVVGAARMTASSYMRAKVAQERLVENSWIPYSIVRATQPFEFLGRVADDATVDGVVRAPSALTQAMAADDVAAVLRDVALGPPVHGVVEIGGPEAFPLDGLLRRTLTARRDPRQVVTDPDARYFGARLRNRTLLPGRGARLGAIRLEEWLDMSLPAAGAVRLTA